VIIGAGGHGRKLLDIVEAVNAGSPTFDFVGFLDDGSGPWERVQRRGASVLGPVQRLADFDARYAIGIGPPEARCRIDELATRSGSHAVTLVHPQATVASDVRAAPGLVMAAGSRITTNVTVGRHVHLNVNATLSHDCEVGSYSILNPGAHISGEVSLGASVVVGSGAVVREGCTVGAGTVIGAGAVVINDLPADVTAVGVPAKVIDPRS
jgi:sugar O-acyltransferase (sialic acid O-acetyltransferase NeuD family)